MIACLVAFKRKFPGLYHGVEDVNGLLFRLLHGRLPEVADDVLAGQTEGGASFSRIVSADLPALERFLLSQPADNLRWFSPHAFDAKTLHRLYRNPSFLMMKVTAPDGVMAGYFFLRCFFIGRAFAGLIVDKRYQNRGIGARIWACCAAICAKAGLKMQATISPENLPSVHSCRKGTEITQVTNLDNGYLAVDCQPRKQAA